MLDIKDTNYIRRYVKAEGLKGGVVMSESALDESIIQDRITLIKSIIEMVDEAIASERSVGASRALQNLKERLIE